MENGKDRPERYIPDDPSGKKTPLSTIIPGTTARRMDTVSVSPIWIFHCTLCVHKDDQANCPISTTVGNPPDYLSEQFISSCLKHSTIVTRSFNGPAAVRCSGVSNQLSQENNEPHLEVGVPGLYSGHKNNEDCITTTQDRCNSERDLPITDNRKHTDNNIGTLHWDTCNEQTSSAFSPLHFKPCRT